MMFFCRTSQQSFVRMLRGNAEHFKVFALFLGPAAIHFLFHRFFPISQMERSYEKAEEWTQLRNSYENINIWSNGMSNARIYHTHTNARAPLLAFLLIDVWRRRHSPHSVVNIGTASKTGNWMSKMQSFTFAQKFSFGNVVDFINSPTSLSAAAYRSLLRFKDLGSAKSFFRISIEVLWLGEVWKLSIEPLKFVRALTCHYHWFRSLLYLTMALRL